VLRNIVGFYAETTVLSQVVHLTLKIAHLNREDVVEDWGIANVLGAESDLSAIRGNYENEKWICK
jgi:hypothetical protein